MPEQIPTPEDQMMQWITSKWITNPIHVVAELGIADLYINGIVADMPGSVAPAEKAIAKADLNDRCKAARLFEWLTIGAGVPGCMHGGGSPDGATLVVRFTTPMEEYAKRIINIEKEIAEM